MQNTQKIIEYQHIDRIHSQIVGKKVLVGGCFDLLHIGHVRFLKAAKEKGDILIVALESDEFIQRKKKRQPFHTQNERAEILSQISCVDFVVLLPYFKNDQEYDSLVQKVKPNIIAITENDPQLSKKQQQVEKVGGKVVVVTNYIPHKASGDLLKAIETFE